MKCRACGHVLKPDDIFCDLGAQPLANGLLTRKQLDHAQATYPLRPLVCWNCALVQLPTCPVPEDIFGDDYPFFSGNSATWVDHCRGLADWCQRHWGLGPTDRVLDIGSNDGTLLRAFRSEGAQVVGVEPCWEVAQHALMEGLPTIVDWWGPDTARKLLQTGGTPTAKQGWKAKIITCTNVIAHVPQLVDFLDAIKMVLQGVAIFEFPWLGSMVEDGQFEQIYAEHHCYFSLNSLRRAFQAVGLRMCSAHFLPDIHGGSMRVCADSGSQDVIDVDLHRLLEQEKRVGLTDPERLKKFARIPPLLKRQAWHLLDARSDKRIVGYAASAKAAVALNYFGLGPETIEMVADVTSEKWGKFIPGCRIPIGTEQHMKSLQPDVVVNFAWNWKEESEKRIRDFCPGAEILYLRDDQTEKAVAA